MLKMHLVLLATFLFCLKAQEEESDYHSHWALFKEKYDKFYFSDDEELHRFAIFIENMVKINEHNQKEHGFKLKMNKFGDMVLFCDSQTHEEYKHFLKKSIKPKNSKNIKMFSEIHEVADKINSGSIPSSLDWRDKKHVVSPVKDQGQCGSCYAFGATGAAESNWVLQGKKQTLFSEQQIVDCSSKYGNLGCDGGLQEYVYEYAQQYGFMEEDSYEYLAVKKSCNYSADFVVARVKFFYQLTSGSEKTLTQSLANVGPITVAIDASSFTFQFYSGGVYYSSWCGNGINDLDHAVLAVGYGRDKSGDDYYIVKNSWGEGWGDKGYIYMSRNRKNNCGIATYAVGVVMD